jgi:eukaryotic-like serine/threonine-protein kinase
MSAAAKLVGLTLPNGWKVTTHVQRNQNGTGGTFSQSYVVEKDGSVGFLKAFDFEEAFEPGVNTAEVIEILTAAYNHECDVLEHCRNRRHSNVVLAIDKGHVDVPNLGRMEGRVYYLIFEMAAGDIRCQMDTATSCDTRWCMRVLKDVSLGLWQIHKDMIAHQDTKPSNVLSYPSDGGFKISDFGRSSVRGRPVRHDSLRIAGDRT